MSDHVIALLNVSFAYENRPVLSDATFSIDRGDFVSVIGPNGAGKTTLARLILGLLPGSTGVITVLGESPAQARRKVGYVPQYTSFDMQFPVSVLDVALMGRLTRGIGFYSRSDKAAARRALEEVGVGDLASRSFSALSGGQRQRVLIARALAGEPEIVMMDEPTTGVDSAAEVKMREILRELAKRLTVIVITHDLGFVPDMINKVLCVNRYVRLHRTQEVTPEMIRELFQTNVRMVDHEVHHA